MVAGALSSTIACGDNTVPIGPPLERANALFLAAHPDDDFIFMQPELLQRLSTGSTVTVYATTAGPDGVDLHLFEAAKIAYSAMVGTSTWQCGRVAIGAIVAEHCRLSDRPVSIIDLGLSDGGVYGDRRDSLLHLFDGTVAELPAFYGGQVDADTIVDVFTQIIETTEPSAIETLELAANHGRDHSSHMFVASVGLWSAARLGYAGRLTWNRGYNVDVEQPTLNGADLDAARTMLGYFEACAYDCGPCGTSCSSLLAAHEGWLARQYATVRVQEASGRLAFGDRCLDADLTLGDCASAPPFHITGSGALRVGDACVTSSEAGDLTLAACAGRPEQYFVLDSEGALWNGRPPERAGDMTYDHMRCLSAGRASTCGASSSASWMILP